MCMMLRLSRHSSVRLVRAPLRQRNLASETLNATDRLSSLLVRNVASLGPHALGETSNDSTASTRWLLQAGRRHAIDAGGLARPLVCPPISSALGQRRRLSSKGGGKSGKGGTDGKDDGMFDRLKKTFEEEVDKVLVFQHYVPVELHCCEVLLAAVLHECNNWTLLLKQHAFARAIQGSSIIQHATCGRVLHRVETAARPVVGMTQTDAWHFGHRVGNTPCVELHSAADHKMQQCRYTAAAVPP